MGDQPLRNYVYPIGAVDGLALVEAEIAKLTQRYLADRDTQALFLEAYQELKAKPSYQHIYSMGGRDYSEEALNLIHNLIGDHGEPKIWCSRRAIQILDAAIPAR